MKLHWKHFPNSEDGKELWARETMEIKQINSTWSQASFEKWWGDRRRLSHELREKIAVAYNKWAKKNLQVDPQGEADFIGDLHAFQNAHPERFARVKRERVDLTNE